MKLCCLRPCTIIGWEYGMKEDCGRRYTYLTRTRGHAALSKANLYHSTCSVCFEQYIPGRSSNNNSSLILNALYLDQKTFLSPYERPEHSIRSPNPDQDLPAVVFQPRSQHSANLGCRSASVNTWTSSNLHVSGVWFRVRCGVCALIKWGRSVTDIKK
jgi:hypothetical protein